MNEEMIVDTIATTELVDVSGAVSPVFHPLSLCSPDIERLQTYRSDRGVLFNGDCLEVLSQIHDETIDTAFADPPFNLAKQYGSKVNDDIAG
jgi:hypothetical protein